MAKSPVSFTFANKARFQKELNILKNRVGIRVSKSMQEIGQHLEGQVKLSISGQKTETKSVDTGRFMNSVTHDTGRDWSVTFTDVSYAPFLEDGTSKIIARNHFKNTLAREKNKIVKLIQRILAGKTV